MQAALAGSEIPLTQPSPTRGEGFFVARSVRRALGRFARGYSTARRSRERPPIGGVAQGQIAKEFRVDIDGKAHGLDDGQADGLVGLE